MKFLFLMAIAIFSSVIFNGCKENTTEPTGSPANIVISRYEVVFDNNQDNRLNPGENVDIDLYAKNMGDKLGKKVYINKIHSISEYIWARLEPFAGQEEFYKDIPGHQEVKLGRDATLKLIIDPATKVDSTYKIAVQLKDENGTEWNDTISVTVVKTGAKIILSRFTINYDNNGNEKANPGESLGIGLFLKNVGSVRANDVKISEIKSLSDYVTARASDYKYDLSYGSILTDQEKYPQGNQYLKVDIKSSIKPDSTYKIRLKISDAEGNVWEETLYLYIEKSKAELRVSKVEIVQDENMDDKPNPGEYIRLLVYVKNYGIDRANDVKMANLKYKSQFLTRSYETEIIYGDVLAGEEKSHSEKYSYLNFTVKASTPIGAILPFTITLQDAEGNEWEDTFEMTVE